MVKMLTYANLFMNEFSNRWNEAVIVIHKILKNITIYFKKFYESYCINKFFFKFI